MKVKELIAILYKLTPEQLEREIVFQDGEYGYHNINENDIKECFLPDLKSNQLDLEPINKNNSKQNRERVIAFL